MVLAKLEEMVLAYPPETAQSWLWGLLVFYDCSEDRIVHIPLTLKLKSLHWNKNDEMLKGL